MSSIEEPASASEFTIESPSRRSFVSSIMGGATLAALAAPHVAVAAPAGPGADGRAAPDDEAYWRWVSDQFLIRPDLTYMNTGTRGPSPRSVCEAQFRAIEGYDADRLSYAKHVQNSDFKNALRARMAELLGCNSKEVAITSNTTEGMAIGTAGIELAAGDEVVYTNHDHSSGAQPINLRAARYGIKPVLVDLSAPRFHPPKNAGEIVAAFEAVITPRTKMLSFCHVNYTDGCVLPVKEICAMARDRGILTLVDGAHPPGMMELDLHDLGCDMYAGACHKWMMAAMLTGFFYVREDIQDRVWPLSYSGPVNGMNMYGFEQPAGSYLELSKSAAKYEMHGSNSYATDASLAASLDFLSDIGQGAIESRDRYMAERVKAGLGSIRGVEVLVADDPALSCGLVAFTVNKVPTVELNDVLWERHGIYIRNVTHEEIGWDANRASLHVMVNGNQVDRFIGAVEEVAKERRS